MIPGPFHRCEEGAKVLDIYRMAIVVRPSDIFMVDAPNDPDIAAFVPLLFCPWCGVSVNDIVAKELG